MAGYMQCFRLRLSTGDPPLFLPCSEALMLVAMQDMQSSKTSFQLVSIDLGSGNPPATLLRMCQANKAISLVLRQVHAALCPVDVTLDQFHFTASKQRHAAIKTMEGPDCFWIFKYGATSRHSHKVRVISLATAVQACQQHGVHPAAIASLQSLGRQGQYAILQPPEHILSLNCTPTVNPSSLLVPLPLPSNLPASPVSWPAPRQRYSLTLLKPHLAKAVVVNQQLAELKTWATTPIQLNRKGPPLQQVSWQNLLGTIWLFLGFCWKWMGIQEPCLQQYLSPHLVASFISFHIALRHCSSTIKQHVATSLKVLAWWSTKPGGHDIGLKLMREQWLPTLSSQVGLAIPKPVKSARDLPTAKTLLTTIVQQRLAVLKAIQETGMTAALARTLHDVTLGSTVFGYLPPIRISCIRSLVLPGYDGACHKPDCIQDSSCHGNQLQLTSNGALHMHLPHHKNEGAWGRAPISFTLPKDLAVIMMLHISQGHKLLTEYIGQETECHVFVDRQGRPFSESNLTIYWDRMLVSMGLNPPISPSLCRQVFVHERRSAERVEGPSDRGAAMVMGHSLAQWSKWYDLDFHSRESQQAVDAMATWRDQLLSYTVEPLQDHETFPLLGQQLQQSSLPQEHASSSPSQHGDNDLAQQVDGSQEGWNDGVDLDGGWNDSGEDDAFVDEDDDDFCIDLEDS